MSQYTRVFVIGCCLRPHTTQLGKTSCVHTLLVMSCCWHVEDCDPVSNLAVQRTMCTVCPVLRQIVYRVGRTMFETSSLPQHLVDHCNAMDEVWVPTEFNR